MISLVGLFVTYVRCLFYEVWVIIVVVVGCPLLLSWTIIAITVYFVVDVIVIVTILIVIIFNFIFFAVGFVVVFTWLHQSISYHTIFPLLTCQ